jgi:flagellar biogenesis protein FliO
MSKLKIWRLTGLRVLRQINEHEMVIVEVGDNVVVLGVAGEKVVQEENGRLATISVQMKTWQERHLPQATS